MYATPSFLEEGWAKSVLNKYMTGSAVSCLSYEIFLTNSSFNLNAEHLTNSFLKKAPKWHLPVQFAGLLVALYTSNSVVLALGKA